MKLFSVLIVCVVILLCFVGFTQNEFIGEPVATAISSYDAGFTFNSVRVGDTVNLAIVEEGILLSCASFTIINNEDRLMNPFNVICRIESCAIITGQTETNNDTFAYKYTISRPTMRIDNYRHTFGADNLKYPMQNLLVS